MIAIREERLIAEALRAPSPKLVAAQERDGYMTRLRWKRAELQIELAAMQARLAEIDHLIGEALAEMRRRKTGGA